jgi:hypothetical protein
MISHFQGRDPSYRTPPRAPHLSRRNHPQAPNANPIAPQVAL